MKTNVVRSGVLLLAALLPPTAWAQPNLPQINVPPPPPPPANPVKKAVDEFFSSVKNRVIADADKLDQWKRDADAAASKTASDFASCPSPDAQALYDDLKAKRQKAVAVREAAARTVADADRALADCLRNWPDGPGPGGSPPSPCRASYSGLPFVGIREAASIAINRLDLALAAIRALKCIAGCDAYVNIVAPSCGPEIVNAMKKGAPAGMAVAPAGFAAIGAPGGETIDVCVAWDRGSLSANWDLGDGQLSAGVKAKLPKCAKWEKIPIRWCSNWDVKLIFPKLKSLKLIPPEVSVGDVTLEVPRRDVGYVTVGRALACDQPVLACKRAAGNFAFDTGADPLTALRGLQSKCTESATIGCSQPPFGLAVEQHSASIPDPVHAKLSWRGAKFKPGSIELDLTKGEFSAACKATGGPGSAGGANVDCKPAVFQTPFCKQPRFGTLVGNP
ncbi:MAG: hypothetical protein ABI768_10335 [Acidobacteriota bacterium]